MAPGRAGVPPAPAGILPASIMSENGAPLQRLLFASGEDALRGGRDARPTRGHLHRPFTSASTAPSHAPARSRSCRRACGRFPRRAPGLPPERNCDSVRPFVNSFVTTNCAPALAATCGRCEMQRIWCDFAERAHFRADRMRDLAADVGVDLIEDEERDGVLRGQRGLDREHDARDFTRGGDGAQRLGRLAGIRREEELGGFQSGGGGLRVRMQLDA